MTPEEVVERLDALDDAAVLGEPETEHLDFKEQPYLLNTDKGRWELAKDVAALANSGGGCLVIGVGTATPADREEEVASEIKPFPAALADVQQMRTTIDATSGVYPVLKRVEIRRLPRDGSKVLAIVRVPAQDEDDLPFVVVRMVEGDEKRGVGIGVPLRSGPHTYWVPPGQLHRDLSDGRRARTTRRSTFEPPATAPRPGAIRERAEVQLQRIEQYMGWSEAPTLMLAAIPLRPQQVPIDGLYDHDRIYGCVSAPPELRYAGFNLAWRAEPENINGALVNATAERQILWVESDGAAFAGAVGLQTFLTRSGGTREAQQPEPRIINPTVLVEWTYLFFKFVTECMAPSIDGPMRSAVRLIGTQSRPWPLLLVGGSTREFWADGRPAGMDDFYAELDLVGDPERDAFVVLERVYSVFGLSESEIPYCGSGRVDPALIQSIR